MTLRILLVGLVASLGFELPSGQDITGWTTSTRQWLLSRVSDLPAPRIEADRIIDHESGCHLADEPVPIPLLTDTSAKSLDVAFDSASEAMATSFTADLQATQSRTLKVVEDPPIEAEKVVETVPTIDSPRSTDLEEELSSRAERIAEAVRLTREAAQAWASVIQETSVTNPEIDTY